MIKCDMCGKVVDTAKPRIDGCLDVPVAVTFELSDGDMITACSECVARVSEDHDYLNRFLEERDKKDGN